MGGGAIAFFLGGKVVRCWSIIKEKSPDFRSPEVGISDYMVVNYEIIA